MGRVRIQFPWDRYGEKDEFSSCWVQVSQSWAGSQYGMIAIPRIGTDVIVTFLNGDPDQPIITGRTFDVANLPPYELPQNKTKTVWRSQTHQGEGFNGVLKDKVLKIKLALNKFTYMRKKTSTQKCSTTKKQK